MRIARILTRLNLGGPARQALAADPLLVERGHTLRLFTGTPEPGEGDLFEEARARGLDVVRIRGLRRGPRPLADLQAARRLRRELASFAPDLIHTHASKAGFLGRRAAGRLPAAARTARVHTFHGHVLEGYFGRTVSRRLVRVEADLARETDRVLCVSHATADDILRLGVAQEDQLVVVQPGIDLAPLLAIDRSAQLEGRTPSGEGSPRALLGAGPDAVLVGVVGRLAEVKQPLRALAVFEEVAQRYPAAQLVFLGDGDGRRALETALRASPFAERVHLLGAVPEMVPALRDLDVVLSASRSEGMPVALIEAAAAALPVVARDVGGVSELVPHERTGFLGRTDTELAFGLASLLGDAELRRAMGERARLRVRARHSAEALASRLEEVYEAALETRRTGARRGGS